MWKVTIGQAAKVEIFGRLDNRQPNVKTVPQILFSVCNPADSSGTLKTYSHIACRAHAAPMHFPCHAVPLRVWNLSFPFVLHSVALSDSHMPCHAHVAPMPNSDHAVLLKATAQHGRRETACGLPARVRILPATTRSSRKIVIRSILIFLTTIHT
jgi:hypothetical protein